MKIRHCLVALLVAVLSSLLLANSVTAGSKEEAIKHLFAEYIEAWNNGNFDKIASEIYRTPVHIFDKEATTTFLVPGEIIDLLRALRVDLDAAGFSHSELNYVGVCDLGDGLAFATSHYRRFGTTGAGPKGELLSSAYIVRKTPEGWRLAGHIFQSKTSELSCGEIRG